MPAVRRVALPRLLCLLSVIAAAAAAAADPPKVHWSTVMHHPLDEDGNIVDPSAYNVGKGVSLAVQTAQAATNPNVVSVGTAIGTAGSLIAMVAPPPAGLVVGGALGLVGGLMSAFGDDGSTPAPSTQDVIDAQHEDAEKVQALLGSVLDAVNQGFAAVETDLEEMTSALGQMEATLAKLQVLVKQCQPSGVRAAEGLPPRRQTDTVS